jgi:internalin A
MPNLTRLGFEAIDISDDGFASFFTGANLPKLYSLNLNSNKSLTDISAITKANLPTMADKSLVPDGEESKLFLSNTGVTSLSPLSGLKSFDSMMVGETQINSFEGLENMNLTKLIANNCKVADLTPLTGMTNLSELNVSYTLVGQLDPLFNLENLRQLSVSRSKVTFMEIQEFKSHNPNCVVANI